MSQDSGVTRSLRRQARSEIARPDHHGDGLQRVEVRVLPGEPDDAVGPEQVLGFQRVASPLVEEEVKVMSRQSGSLLPLEAEGSQVTPTL